jgi:hypothetical protein
MIRELGFQERGGFSGMMDPKETPMENPAKDTFDPKNFLAKVGTGKTILKCRKNEHVFEQGDVPDTVHEWSRASHINHDGDGRLLDHGDHEGRDDRRNP